MFDIWNFMAFHQISVWMDGTRGAGMRDMWSGERWAYYTTEIEKWSPLSVPMIDLQPDGGLGTGGTSPSHRFLHQILLWHLKNSYIIICVLKKLWMDIWVICMLVSVARQITYAVAQSMHEYVWRVKWDQGERNGRLGRSNSHLPNHELCLTPVHI